MRSFHQMSVIAVLAMCLGPLPARAQEDFSAALRRPTGAGGGGPRRSAALQAFLLANTGRSLLPGHEASGTLSPQLKTEEP